MCGSSAKAACWPSRSPGPSGATRSRSRCMRRSPTQSKARPAIDRVRVDHHPRRGPGFRRRQRPCRFPRGPPRDNGEIPVWRLLRALAECEIPLIAAVHGNCVGIGTTMLLHCDLVVADDGARFSMPFVDLALVPEAASSLLLPRLAGRRRAARYLLLAEPFGAAEALHIGLVSHVAPEGGLDANARRRSRSRCWPNRPRRCALPSACFATVRATRSSNGCGWKAIISPNGWPHPRSRQAIAAFFARRSRDSEGLG